MQNIHRRHFLQLLAMSPLMLSACSNAQKFGKIPKGSRVVALGDSLTFGYGADKGQDYPSVLAGLTGWQIDNMGVNGNTSQDVLERLAGVLAKKPKLVLFGIGGNDVLRKVAPSETRANIINATQQLTEQKIPVVLIAEPHLSASALFGKASDNPIYKEIADELGVPLLEKAWSKVLSDDKLKSDQIHANNAGYQVFAENLYEFLKEIGYA